jgi:hypothetical protein
VAAQTYGGTALEANAIVPLRPTGRNEPFTFVLDGRDRRLLVAADPLNRVAFAPVAP